MASAAAAPRAPIPSTSGSNKTFNDRGKPMEVRMSNLVAAKAISDAVRTSLGPRGMDKMIQTSKGEVVVTNDGATILKSIQALHPASKMLVDLSAAQDVEAGDGTTSVVVLAGSLLGAAEKMLQKGIHPTIIAESFLRASTKAVEFLTEIATPIDLNDRATLLRAASTSLNSKARSEFCYFLQQCLTKSARSSLNIRPILAPIAVSAVTRLVTPTSENVDLRDIRIVKKVGGTIEDTELIDGVVLNQNVVVAAGGPTRIEKAKIGLIQFHLSAPKPDMDNTVVINDYRQMDKVIKEGRTYLLNICKKIKKSGCNVLLIQKSILRDAVDDTSLTFLKRLNILAVKDVERDEIDFLTKSLGCKPVADIEAFTEDKLGYADLVEETNNDGTKVVKITGVKNRGRTVSILAMSSNQLVLDECERSIHDALCVVRCLVKKRALIGGGGAPEIHVSRMLSQYAQGLTGMEAYCFQAYADALEVIPTTLAENAGLNPIAIVTELRNRHALGERNAGINVRKGQISNILEEDVVQPLLVSTSAIELSTETVTLLLKIDDYVQAR
ncbi:T-complex protein 1 [Lactarius pseudohatsudake]|nr:T-complex protein 1 [Lactarius pseudohatsudake]